MRQRQSMNFNHLYYFYVTFKNGGVSEATVELGISQATLSAQLKTFQERYGKVIYQKTGRRLTLTPEGLELYERAQTMFYEFEGGDFAVELVTEDEAENIVVEEDL